MTSQVMTVPTKFDVLTRDGRVCIVFKIPLDSQQCGKLSGYLSVTSSVDEVRAAVEELAREWNCDAAVEPSTD